MVDIWLEAMENNEVTAAVMLDMSAAFDMVDHGLLLIKLAELGLTESSIKWFRSYLSERSKQVYIDGVFSDPLDLEAGVPQGSILGPLLYICFTNDLPEVVHNHLSNNNTLYNIHCMSCGSICSFADDSTYFKSDKDPAVVKQAIDDQYNRISDYMIKNKLVMNKEMTHLIVIATK